MWSLFAMQICLAASVFFHVVHFLSGTKTKGVLKRAISPRIGPVVGVLIFDHSLSITPRITLMMRVFSIALGELAIPQTGSEEDTMSASSGVALIPPPDFSENWGQKYA